MSRKLRKKILGDSLIWVIIAAFVVIMLFPFVYILSTALKSDTDLATSVGRILPKAVQWENFTKAWQLLDFPKCFFNSFIVAIAVTALTIFLFLFSSTLLQFYKLDAPYLPSQYKDP